MSKSTFGGEEIKKNIPKDLFQEIISFMGDIILYTCDDDEISIMESEFRNYERAIDVIKIVFINPITIKDGNIFKNYIRVESMFGAVPIIGTDNLNILFLESSLTEGNLEEWDMSGVKSMESMFYGSSWNKPLNNWNVSNVENMKEMFGKSKYNHPLNNWDVSSVKSMESMFEKSRYNHPLNDWNVSSVEDMNGMFNSSVYNYPLNKWDVSSVRGMSSMFASSLYNHPLNKWDVLSVIDITDMFGKAKYNHPLNRWNTLNIGYMFETFHGSKYNHPLDKWNYDSVSEMPITEFIDTLEITHPYRNESFHENFDDYFIDNLNNMLEF